MFNNRDNYKAALEHIQRVQQAGGWIKFQAVKDQYKLRNATKKALIPNLCDVDLSDEEVFERLYQEQEAFLAVKAQEVAKHNISCYHRLRERVKELEAENAKLRSRIKK